jgi:hypothetical protein
VSIAGRAARVTDPKEMDRIEELKLRKSPQLDEAQMRSNPFAQRMERVLGRIPSAVGYQPTLATDLGTLEERITSTKKGSITSVQAIYVRRSI